jgi:hypothetical protein
MMICLFFIIIIKLRETPTHFVKYFDTEYNKHTIPPYIHNKLLMMARSCHIMPPAMQCVQAYSHPCGQHRFRDTVRDRICGTGFAYLPGAEHYYKVELDPSALTK